MTGRKKMKNPVFIKTYHDSGLCRTYYKIKGLKDSPIYCRYDGEDTMYICSKDGEPSHSIGETKYITE